MNADKQSIDARRRLALSLGILCLFWGALFVEYWPDLAMVAMRISNSARSVGAEKVESQYFDVVNNSDASQRQVENAIRRLEKQYEAIAEYSQAVPMEEPIPVIISNGTAPALTDGAQLMLNYGYGRVDVELAPMFLVWMVESIPVNPQDGLVLAGGYALQVVEAAGLGDDFIRQPLDDWVILLRQKRAYLPMEEAWQLVMPSNEQGAYDLMRGMLQAGSFMQWFTRTYGREMAGQLVRGETIESLTGKTLAENEAEWLQTLEQQETRPRGCSAVIPESSQLRLFCHKLAEPQDR